MSLKKVKMVKDRNVGNRTLKKDATYDLDAVTAKMLCRGKYAMPEGWELDKKEADAAPQTDTNVPPKK